MSYLKAILSGLTSIVLAEFVPGLWSAFTDISGEKATGLAVVTGGLMEGLLSPRIWILAVLFFALFFAASRLGNKQLRILLFWIPTLTVTSLAIVGLFTYFSLRFRHS